MNINSLNDPALAALETELQGICPKLTATAQKAILYHAAFRAGKAAATKATRIWQTCALGFGLTLVLTLLPWKQADPAPQITGGNPPTNKTPSMLASPSPPELPLGILGNQGPFVFTGESWKPVENTSEKFEMELNKYALLDNQEKAQSLFQLTRLETVGD